MRQAKTANKSGGVAGLLLLTLIALVMCAVAAFAGKGPVSSPYLEDWLDWARVEPTASGVMVLGVVCAIIGVIGTFVRLLTPKPKPNLPATAVMSGSLKATRSGRLAIDETAPVETGARAVAAPLAVNIADDLGIPVAAVSATAVEEAVYVPEEKEPEVTSVAAQALPETSSQTLSVQPQATQTRLSSAKPASVQPLRPDFSRRGALKFDAASLGLPGQTETTVVASELSVPAVPAAAEASFVTEASEIAQESPAAERYSAEIITLRPQPVPQPVSEPAQAEIHEAIAEIATVAEPLSDPIAAALLADVPEHAPRITAESDINAVISSAMRFIESPAPQVEVTHEALHRAMTEDAGIAPAEVGPEASSWTITHQADTVTEIAPSNETLLAATAAPVSAGETQADRVAAAVEKSLAAWPQTTRPIAADELKVRAAYLAYHPSAEVRAVFDLLDEGNVDLAASCLQTLANSRAFSGQSLEAAELWRAFGALHMGRDDPKAMMAYEQVSALDPSDANIHLYLSRRYAMEGKTGLMLPVLSRALMVTNDAYTRIELLGHYGDLALKAGMLDASAQAFEELSQLQSAQGAASPDNLQLRSAHAISVAKMAQVRELQGQIQQAAPLYREAYKLLADLSARVPDHAGLRAMAANALKDASRLNA